MLSSAHQFPFVIAFLLGLEESPPNSHTIYRFWRYNLTKPRNDLHLGCMTCDKPDQKCADCQSLVFAHICGPFRAYQDLVSEDEASSARRPPVLCSPRVDGDLSAIAITELQSTMPISLTTFETYLDLISKRGTLCGFRRVVFLLDSDRGITDSHGNFVSIHLSAAFTSISIVPRTLIISIAGSLSRR